MPTKNFGTEMLSSSDVQTYLMNQALIRVDSGSRPSNPVTGMHIWESDTLCELVYNGSTWDYADRCDIRAVRKDTTENLQSSTTLQADNDLVVSLPANSIWLLDAVIHVGAATANIDLKIAISSPQGVNPASVTWMSNNTASTNSDDVAISVAPFTTQNITPVYTGSQMWQIRNCLVILGGTAADMGIWWAQNTSTAADLSFYFQSSLYARRVG